METSALFSKEIPPASHISGLKQICGVWISPGIYLLASATFLHYFGIGDYRCIVIDFSISKFLDKGFIPIYKPEMRRLTTKQPKAIQNYLQRAESLFHYHCIH